MNKRKYFNKKREKSGFLSGLTTYLGRQRLGEILVSHGTISPQSLRLALSKQKEKQIPLGQVLIEEGAISRQILFATLFRQHALRLITGMLFFIISIGANNHRAHAEMIQDVPARISLTSAANNAFTKVRSYPALFDTVEQRSNDLNAFTKWTGMFDRFDQQLQQASANETIGEWQKSLSSLQGMPLKMMASRVNNMVNEVAYIVDSKNWGKSDYWATPIEFLTRGGDCEDFAIAKYTALRALGVPEERLRVAIVQDKIKNIPHAVLIVYTEEGPYILDNQIKTLVNADRAGRYQPIFSINRTAWWLHTSREATVLASAQH